jgi:sporulation protein YlmC with PRC-barrel domain
MDLVGDLLDKRVLDRNGRYVGTIDSIVLEIDGDAPPAVSAVLIGAPALLRRLHPRLARWGRRLPLTELPMSKIREAGMDVEVDVDGERHSTLLTIEKWIRTHIVERIPGNGR